MTLLAGTTALVTGAARGIGQELALGLARAGARVALADVLDTAESKRRLAAEGLTDVLGVRMDVTDFGSVRAGVDAALAHFGTITILVNNAGLYGGMARVPFAEISEAEWDRMMAVNVKGIWNVTRAVAPAMQERGYGKIVNVSSSTILMGLPNMLHYVASKGAVFAMTRSLSRELGPHGIRVNTLLPGLTLSEASRASFAGREEAVARMGASAAIGRLQEPADLVGTVVFLSSPLSDTLTGQALNVDGGLVNW